MASPSLHEFKKQASFFFKEKIKIVRMVLTDVTPAEILTEEATDGDSLAPDSPTMGLISRAAFEVDDYWRIVHIMHKRFWKFDKENWRASYKALILLEHLLTHGPARVAEEFECDKDVIKQMSSFQYVDEKGFNWGSSIKEKSERILKLLDHDRTFLKEERSKARKLTSGIKGYGSFCQRSCIANGSLNEPKFETYLRCNSHFNERRNCNEDGNLVPEKLTQNSNHWSSVEDAGNRMDNFHPFYQDENQTKTSLLSSSE